MSNWIWSGSIEHKHELNYFRRNFKLENTDNMSLKTLICAEGFYKLYINGVRVCYGPCKGTHWERYYDEVDLSEYLKIGKNTIGVVVLRLIDKPITERASACPANFISSDCGFMLHGGIKYKGKTIQKISTDENWLFFNESKIKFISSDYGQYVGAGYHLLREHLDNQWNTIDYDDSLWKPAVIFAPTFIGVNTFGEIQGRELKPRQIPMQKLDYKDFTDFHIKTIPANTIYEIVLDAGELTTGYLILKTVGGEADFELVYSECYVQKQGKTYVKMIRDDKSGVLIGDRDLFEKNDGCDIFESMTFRTFRYVKLKVQTRERDVKVCNVAYLKNGYPLNIEGSFQSSLQNSDAMWKVSVRTLLCCMHDTYEDCPYYEQLQYIMDTRLQALFTYQISNDNRLAKRAIWDFHSSLMPEGLLQSRYPSTLRQVIPGFSLHFIYMLHDYLYYWGDMKFLKLFLPTIDAILTHFDMKIGKFELVESLNYWEYVDWVSQWQTNKGSPPKGKNGILTVYNLMYAVALENAAEINRFLGRNGMSKEYLLRKSKILGAIQKNCWDDTEHLYCDGVDIKAYSMHTQFWAVLAKLISKKQAKSILQNAIQKHIAQPSYAMSYFYFRALEQSGLYDYMIDKWEPWHKMLKLHVTTWMEDFVTQRSDCHAWGSLPIYEYTAMVLGVRPNKIAYKEIRIEPHIGLETYAKGIVCTKNGNVSVEWKVEKNKFYIEIIAPKNIPVVLLMPDGLEQHFNGKYHGICNIDKKDKYL